MWYINPFGLSIVDSFLVEFYRGLQDRQISLTEEFSDILQEEFNNLLVEVANGDHPTD